MNKIQRSWVLLKSSLSVIGRNKQLLVFPISIFICTSVIILFFLAPPVLRPTGHSYFSTEHWQTISHSLFRSTTDAPGSRHVQVAFTPAAMAYLAFLYFVSMFIATFCNVAFYHEILAALRGQPVSIARGVKFASSRLGAILLWTLFAGIVGLIIKMIEERLPLVGRIIARLIGIAWSIAAVFVIPVIVSEEKNANPFVMLRKSATILRNTWGEALIGYAGLALANSLIMIGSLLLLAAAVVLSIVLHTFLIIALVGFVWLIAILAWGYLSGVASNVYKGALYLYAAEGVVAEPYNQEMFDMAWKYRKS
jgi:hypothetical protein